MTNRSNPIPNKRRRVLRSTPKPKILRPSSKPEPVGFADVILVPAKGTLTRGGGKGGEAWRVEVAGKIAGRVFINFIDEAPIGTHASIQIFLNQTHRDRKIGRVAYRKACEASAYDTVYAHMRKSNIASVRAAEQAGFIDATPAGVSQKVMVWHREQP